MDSKLILKNIGKVFVVILSGIALFFIYLFAAISISFSNVNGDIYLYILLVAALLIEIVIIGALWGFIKRRRDNGAYLCCGFFRGRNA